MKARTIPVVAALVVALIGVAIVLIYARGADQRAVAGQQPAQVYLAAKPVPAGTSAAVAASTGLIVKVAVAAKGVPAGALRAIDGVTSGLVATTDIASGEFVLTSRFGAAPQAKKAIDVPAGQVAVAVQMTEPAKVGAFITPGTHIVLYDTFATVAKARGQQDATQKTTRVLLDDVLVIAVGATSLQPAADGATKDAGATDAGALVTVAVPPASAMRLVQAAQTGSLYAALRGNGTKPDAKTAVDQSTLFAR